MLGCNMIYVLRHRDRKLYVVAAYSNFDKPYVNRVWYPTGTSTVSVQSNYGHDFEGYRLARVESWLYRVNADAQGRAELYGLHVSLQKNPNTEEIFEDRVDVPLPKTRRKTEIFWNDEAWWTYTKKGKEIVGVPDLYALAMEPF